ncbi:MAG: ATP-binding cassette domain-containing protein [Leptolyngbyaceae cyanobacterium SM2_3_12]|nr:ATP-binding cassette domain-containing protein [Leptolyngbyaceae cyanobacterium SM2_3_12]
MKASPPLLKVQNLGRKLADRWLWRGVNLDLWPGEAVGLVAPSGAGKTLLMRNLVLLDPIQQGQIWFEGKTPTDWSLPIYRTRVMYLPQRATAFEGTVQENLKQVFELGVYRQRRFNPEQIKAWLSQLGRSPDFLTWPGPRLSGGETQLLALLRVLQLAPQVLLLDEPTASLDADTTAQVEGLLQSWLQQPGRACLFTSHDGDQIRRVTHRQLNLGEFI